MLLLGIPAVIEMFNNLCRLSEKMNYIKREPRMCCLDASFDKDITISSSDETQTVEK